MGTHDRLWGGVLQVVGWWSLTVNFLLFETSSCSRTDSTLLPSLSSGVQGCVLHVPFSLGRNHTQGTSPVTCHSVSRSAWRPDGDAESSAPVTPVSLCLYPLHGDGLCIPGHLPSPWSSLAARGGAFCCPVASVGCVRHGWSSPASLPGPRCPDSCSEACLPWGHEASTCPDAVLAFLQLGFC